MPEHHAAHGATAPRLRSRPRGGARPIEAVSRDMGLDGVEEPGSSEPQRTPSATRRSTGVAMRSRRRSRSRWRRHKASAKSSHGQIRFGEHIEGECFILVGSRPPLSLSVAERPHGCARDAPMMCDGGLKPAGSAISKGILPGDVGVGAWKSRTNQPIWMTDSPNTVS